MKEKILSRINPILTGMVVVFIIGCLFQIFVTHGAYYSMDRVEFYNLDEQNVYARYHQGSNDRGVFIINDLHQSAKDASLMVREFVRLGYSVYVFDLPSQGHTGGNMKFMYKSNDYMAEQYYTAVVAFSQMADLNEEKIHIVANGAGARVALQTATKHFFKPRDLTLISTEMNLRAKLDFDVINFVREKDVSFMKALNLKNPGENIHLITSSLNSSSGIKENTLLKEMLERKGSGKGADNKVVLSTVSLANPINEISNGSVIRSTVEYIAKRDGTTYEGNSSLFFLQMITALLHVLLFAIVVYAYKLIGGEYYKERGSVPYDRNFVKAKLLAIIPAAIILFLLPIALYFSIGAIIPMPYFILAPISALASYGITVFYLYYRTDVANDLGSRMFYKDPRNNVRGGIQFTIAVAAMMVLLSFAGGNIILNPVTYKSVWIAIFTVLCMFTFYIEEREKDVLIASQSQRYYMSVMNFSAVLLVLILLVLFGRFYMAANIVKYAFYIVLVLAIGKLLKAVNSPTRVNAVIQALILCTIMVSQTVLFF